LLPVDANPWTAVITKMHFGDPIEPPETAGFKFFTHEEWRDITEPESTLERLHRQAAVYGALGSDKKEQARLEGERHKVLERARARLGKELDGLLGSEHRHAAPTREVLERYLASGDLHDPNRPDAGKFSDVTREADLFLPLAPFAEPCVLVDTPGTNDPFKARSEVTLKYLAKADAYIVLLGGPSALGAHDVSLFDDLVRGLHKERIVVFINRIDSFTGIPGDTRKVRKRVEDWLRSHHPSLNIPVLTGSAWWAEQTFHFSARVAQRFLVNDGACEYGIEQKVFTKEQLATWEVDPTQAVDEVSRAMLELSGLPAARRAVIEVLMREKGRALLEGAGNNLLAKAKAFAAESAQLADRLDSDATTMEGDAESVQQQLDALTREIEGLASTREAIEVERASAEKDLAAASDEALADLRSALSRELEIASLKEGKKLRENGIGIFDSRIWSANVREIRDTIEKTFLRAYPKISKDTNDAQQRLRSRLRRRLAELSELGAIEIDASPPVPIDPSPSLEALGEDCDVDLGGFWERILAGKDDVEEKAAELEEAVQESFERVIDGLVESAREEVTTAVRRTKQTCAEAVARGVKRIGADVASRRTLFEARLAEKDPAVAKMKGLELRAQAAALRDRQAKLAEVTDAITRFLSAAGQ
jgi:hypothetical protein